MWKRASSKLLSLRSVPKPNRIVTPSLSPATTIRPFANIVSRHYSGNVAKKVEDVMPIATGHEREELEAELQGRDILEINHPEGPFGTKFSIGKKAKVIKRETVVLDPDYRIPIIFLQLKYRSSSFFINGSDFRMALVIVWTDFVRCMAPWSSLFRVLAKFVLQFPLSDILPLKLKGS